jgi:predicted amidohydrolase
MLNVHCIAAANANRVFVAAANRVGGGYLGRSCVVDVTGGVLALAGGSEEGLIGAELELDRAHREKELTDLAHALGDRNPAVYEGEAGEEP